jgi:hypothetical protein
MTGSVRLLDNASATGSPRGWLGGAGVFTVAGSFGGATVKLQQLGPDGSTWLDISGGAVDFTAPGQGGFVLPAGPIRAAVSGGTPSGLEAVAAQV